jgi:amino acid transporter
MMPNLDLFAWWIISISWSIAFLIAVSIYLYGNSRTRRKESNQTAANRIRLGKDFVFVWVLLGLLVFYIVSVNKGSSVLFAAGNIVVEVILIIYLMKSRHEKSEQTASPGSK